MLFAAALCLAGAVYCAIEHTENSRISSNTMTDCFLWMFDIVVFVVFSAYSHISNRLLLFQVDYHCSEANKDIDVSFEV